MTPSQQYQIMEVLFLPAIECGHQVASKIFTGVAVKANYGYTLVRD